jgi:ribosomal protein L16 Arg81 hydroxylase
MHSTTANLQTGPFDLEQLLRPVGIEAFFAGYWEKKHLWLQRSQPNFYQSLLTAGDLEDLISRSDARYPAIRLARGGGYFPPEAYTRNVKHGDESFNGVPDLQRISDEYRQGATVALTAIHRTWPPLTALCDALQAQLDHAAHANVYITPGNTRGFTPHYDVHEVFVLQIAGRKRWQLYEPVIPLPHRSQPFRPELYAGQAPMDEIELDAGDLLYLPRGILHSTNTADRFSAHVTIGITVYTWADLVKEFLGSAIDDEEMRQALPPGFATHGELRPLLQRRMVEMFDKLRASPDTGRLIGSFTQRIRATHARRTPPFRADVTVINLNSRLQAPPPDSYRITQEGDTTMLEFQSTRYHMPVPVAATLRAISKLRSFQPADLTGPLNAQGMLALSRHLVDIGFLTIAVDQVP